LAPQFEQKVVEASSWVPQLGQNFIPGAGITVETEEPGPAGAILARFE